MSSWPLLAMTVWSLAMLVNGQQWTSTPFTPPAVPLAVRSPYLNSWLPQGPNPPAANEAWAKFWSGMGTTGNTSDTQWFAAVNVDGTPYQIIGNASVPKIVNARQTAMEFTATRTSMLFEAGPMEINATFLSPIEPFNLTTLSFPYVFFYMTAKSTDGQSHHVQMYSDISSQWAPVLGDGGPSFGYSNFSNGLGVHTFIGAESTPLRFVEVGDQITDAVVYYSMASSDGVSFELGLDEDLRSTFADGIPLLSGQPGATGGALDPNVRLPDAIGKLIVGGIAVDLGSIKETASPVVWQLSLAIVASIQYPSLTGSRLQSPYYWSQIPLEETPNDAQAMVTLDGAQGLIESTLNDFNQKLAVSVALDNQIRADGLRVSSNYSDILALSLRQVMGSLEITVPVGSDGQWNTTSVMAFMKNMGGPSTSPGTSINSVDILYSSFPAFLYLNANLGGYLLESLLDIQDRSGNPLPYPAQNLGTSFPNATGNAATHNFGIEEAANMLIMTSAYLKAAGVAEGNFVGRHYGLLKSWADYLVANALVPGSQTTPDYNESTMPINSTNLALKGILGIGAMAQISEALNSPLDSASYQRPAASLIGQWERMTVSTDDTLKLSYNSNTTTGLMYNFYADTLLNLDLIPQSVYGLQEVFLGQRIAEDSFGIANTIGGQEGRGDWLMLAAGGLPSESFGIRDALILHYRQYVSSRQANNVLSIAYDAVTGAPLAGDNNPAVGAVFSILAINHTNTVLPFEVGSGTAGARTPAWVIIVASVLSSVFVLAIVFTAGVFLRRRRRRRRGIAVRPNEWPSGRFGQRLNWVRLRNADFLRPGTQAVQSASAHDLSHFGSNVASVAGNDLELVGLPPAYLQKGLEEERRAKTPEPASKPFEGGDIKTELR